MQEITQVRLRIISPDKEIYNDELGTTVSGKDILKQMKLNGVFRNDSKGKYVGIQFDSFEFVFREGETLTVTETIARSLRRSSVICVGSDKLNGPLVPFLEIVEKYELSAPDSQKTAVTPTTCGICGVDQKTFPALTRHLGQERKKHPELFEEKTATTDWEGKSGTSTDEVEE